MYYVSVSLLSIPCEILSFIGPRKVGFSNYSTEVDIVSPITRHFLAAVHST